MAAFFTFSVLFNFDPTVFIVWWSWLQIQKNAVDEFERLIPDPDDHNQLVTLEVAVAAQILLANRLRQRILPTMFINYLTQLLDGTQDFIQGWGMTLNVFIEAPLYVSKAAVWFNWILEPFVKLPEWVEAFAKWSFYLRIYLDAATITCREKLLKSLAIDMNKLSAEIAADARKNVLFAKAGKRGRRKVWSRK